MLEQTQFCKTNPIHRWERRARRNFIDEFETFMVKNCLEIHKNAHNFTKTFKNGSRIRISPGNFHVHLKKQSQLPAFRAPAGSALTSGRKS